MLSCLTLQDTTTALTFHLLQTSQETMLKTKRTSSSKFSDFSKRVLKRPHEQRHVERARLISTALLVVSMTKEN